MAWEKSGTQPTTSSSKNKFAQKHIKKYEARYVIFKVKLIKHGIDFGLNIKKAIKLNSVIDFIKILHSEMELTMKCYICGPRSW